LGVEFERTKFEFLERVIHAADRVVINGDFWEGYFASFDEFMKSEWRMLFPVLKNKQAIYLFGNHDQQRWTDGRVDQFCLQTGDEYRFKSGGKSFLVTHGHDIDKLDECAKWRRSGWRGVGKVIVGVEDLLVKIGGLRWQRVRSSMAVGRQRQRVELMKGKQETVICGHTHVADLDLYNGYVNDGFIGEGFGQYVVVEEGKVEVIRSRYEIER
jgi:predicted phosphodiesterase